jgi:DNA-binding transcriptional regulator YiaG
LRLEVALAFSKEALVRARRNRGLSQSEAAAITGFSIHNIRAWEQGKWVPTDENQLLLARRLHVELIDLHTHPQPMTAA